MSGLEDEKRYHRVKQPKLGVDYSAVLGEERHIIRVEAKFPDGSLIFRIKETGQIVPIDPVLVETAEPT